MDMKRTALLLPAVMLAVFGLAFAQAETITFWDGEKLEAEVQEVSSRGAVVVHEGERLLVTWDKMRPEEAVRIWEAHLDKTDAQAWFELGTFALDKGLKGKAKRFFEQATALDPTLADKVPSLSDPSADRERILKLIADAKKAESQKRFEEAVALLQRVLEWPDAKVLEDVLRDTDFLDRIMLADYITRLKHEVLKRKGYSRMGRRWVTSKERKFRERDLEERDQSARLDAADDEKHASWENARQRRGSWYVIRTNVPKWYFRRYINRLDILYDTMQDVLKLRVLAEEKMKVFIYASRALYIKETAAIMPGASSLGGFYANKEIHLFLEADQDDLAYEDLSVLSLDYLAARLFLHSLSDDVPFWLDAGFALYMQDAKWYSALKVEVGKEPNRYAVREFMKALDAGAEFDPARLFSLKDNPTRFDHYSAWALVQYLLNGPPSSARSAFLKGVKQLGKAKDPFSALRGKASSLKGAVEKYISSLPKPLILLEDPPYPMF